MMTDPASRPTTAFAGMRRIARGPLGDVALALRTRGQGATEPVLVFDDATGRVVDLDLRGEEAEVLARLRARGEQDGADDGPPRGRGRPRLGVVAREVTLLPRHWEWLAARPGGASNALRRLVDEARRADDGGARRAAARDAAYCFMAAMAGDLPGFEEASRALFAGDAARFRSLAEGWPADVAAHVRSLSADAFAVGGAAPPGAD